MNANALIRGLSAIVILFAIGCADGQRQSKGSNGKGKRIWKTQGPGGTAAKGADDKNMAASADPTKPANAADSANQKTLDETTKALESGAEVQALPEGTYQLVSSTTFVNVPSTTEFMQALRKTNYAPEKSFAPMAEATVPVGVLSTKVTEPTRSIVLPLEFTVAQNQPTVDPTKERVLTSTVAMKVSAVSIDEKFEMATGANLPKINLMELMGVEAKDDGAGNQAKLQMISQLANGDVLFFVSIEESQGKTLKLYRNFYLTYKVTANAPAAKPAAGQELLEKAPATN